MAKHDRESMANRFDAAWKALESELKHRWRERTGGGSGQQQTTFSMLTWARDQKLLTTDQERFLDRCRSVRNAYAHVSFEGYSGPVASPPREIVERLEKILGGLRHPRKVGEIATEASTCLPTTPLREALQTMHRGDFSQLPYRDEQRGWLLVTREQVGRWAEAKAEADGMVLLDLSAAVSELADHPEVGPVRPSQLDPSAALASAVAALESALHRPDDADGGYPLVLVTGKGAGAPVQVLAVDDLPRAYRELGR
ncbi:hypothetical protein [Micromonospora cremea]|uniref:CBS domain-containing protein n=1 Tax=Micromonospora cremea TaxID=709881 RepID=A0A1N5VVX2_9ACTN|nr:hypothetical protein [Micromonospora cremea]SIM77086.1 hypothetical protein SAMN04489832_1919 [Micromonospora cremea]